MIGLDAGLKRNLIRQSFLVIFLPVTLVVFCALLWMYHLETRFTMDGISKEEAIKVQLGKSLIVDSLSMCTSDLLFLESLVKLKNLSEASFQSSNDPAIETLKQEFLAFSTQRKIYDQIRLIDINGDERLRINYDGATSYPVSAEELQSKKERYYFKEAIGLAEGELYVSPLDLNIENGQLEDPYKPMIRIGIPLYSSQNEKIGILILNYLAEGLLAKFQNSTNTGLGFSMLLNQEGYWLVSPNQDDLWGFMFARQARTTFAARYPDTWRELIAGSGGEIRNKEGLFSYQTVFPFRAETDRGVPNAYFWKIVSHVSASVIDSKKQDAIVKYITVLLFFELLLLLVLHYRIRRAILLATTQEAMIRLDKLNTAGQLAAGVAHEVRNPLTVVKGSLQWLSLKYKEQQTYYDLMLSEIERIETVISDFLALAKPQATNMRQVDIAKVLKDIITLFETKTIMSNIQIVLEAEDGLPPTICCQDQIKQVIVNVIQNSIDAMPLGGTITVKLSRSDKSHLLLRFVDTGTGIPAERLGNLFEPFYTTKEKGTGLGLAIVYNIIKNHRGSVTVTSSVGQGTTVSIVLPLRQ